MTKTTTTIQYAGQDINMQDVEKTVKQYWKKDGHKLGEMKTIDFYIKPEERAVYYAINGEEQTGRVDF